VNGAFAGASSSTMEIREKAIGQAPPPGREEILRVFVQAR
jgi:hypothetical protein